MVNFFGAASINCLIDEKVTSDRNYFETEICQEQKKICFIDKLMSVFLYSLRISTRVAIGSD